MPAEVIMRSLQEDAVLPSSDVDGLLGELTQYEIVVFSAAMAAAAWFAHEDRPHMVALAIWVGLALVAASLELRVRRRQRAVAKASEADAAATAGGESALLGGGGLEDRWSDDGGSGGQSPQTAALGGGSDYGDDNGRNHRLQRTMPVPYDPSSLQCVRIEEARSRGKFAEYRIVVAFPPSHAHPLQDDRPPAPAGGGGSGVKGTVVTSASTGWRVAGSGDGGSGGSSATKAVLSANNPCSGGGDGFRGGSAGGWTLWRRYSEFRGLRADLRRRGLLGGTSSSSSSSSSGPSAAAAVVAAAAGAPPSSSGPPPPPAGWVAPSLPGKTLRRKLDARFLAERRRSLERFLLKLLQHPGVRQSHELRTFLGFGPLLAPPGSRHASAEEGGARTAALQTPSARMRTPSLPSAGSCGHGGGGHGGGGHGGGDGNHGSKHGSFKGSGGGVGSDSGTSGNSGGEGGIRQFDESAAVLVAEAAEAAAAGDEDTAVKKMDAAVAAACMASEQPNIAGQWADAAASHEFQVRGASYLADHVKVKAGPAAAKLVAFRVYACRKDGLDGDRLDHVCARGKCAALMTCLDEITRPFRATPDEPAFFVVNIQVPGAPVVNLVLIFALPTAYAKARRTRSPRDAAEDAKFRRLFKRYYEDLPVNGAAEERSGGGGGGGLDASSMEEEEEEEDEEDEGTDPELRGTCPLEHFRNQRFKLVPRIVDGPFLIRTTVPNKPALLGQKLTQRYFRGPAYVETDVHVGSSVVANNITGLCRGASQKIVLEMGFALEGRSAEELPEKVIGVGRFTYLNVDNCETV